MEQFERIFVLTDGDPKRRTHYLQSQKKLQVAKILKFESGVNDSFEILNFINVISKDYQVFNIKEKDDELAAI